MDWIEVWESVLLRTAAAAIAAGVVGRYVLVPMVRAYKRTKRLARELAAEVEKIRSAVVKVEQITTQELTTNGGASAKDQLNSLTDDVGEIRRDQALMAGSWVKYAFEHAQEHSGLFVWLKKEHGIDRRKP